MHAIVNVRWVSVLGLPRTLRTPTFPLMGHLLRLLLRRASVVLLSDQDHVLILQVSLQNGLVPPRAGCLHVDSALRSLVAVLCLSLVVVASAPLGGLLLNDDVALRLQSLLLDQVGLVLQDLLGFLLVDAGPTVGHLLVGAAREVSWTSVAAAHLRVGRKNTT